MVKPFLELEDAERRSVTKVQAIRGAIGDGYQHWDVYLYSLAHEKPLAHEAPALDDGPVDHLELYVDHYLELLGLKRTEALSGNQNTLGARIQHV